MPLIASIDGATRRIFLHADTVGASVHPIDIYKEMRTLRANDESLRNWNLFMSASGNVPKGGGKFTERLVTLLLGTRIVPFDTDHELTITGTLITDDGTEGIAAFDRTSLSATTQVDINYVPPQVEVITINSGSGLSIEQDGKLTEIHAGAIRFVHLDVNNLGAEAGSPTEPFASFSSAVAYANLKGLKALHVHSNMSLDTDLVGFQVLGLAKPEINLGGFDVSGSSFSEMSLSGSSTGAAGYTKCSLLDALSGLNGDYVQCSLHGDLITQSAAFIVMSNCISGIAGSSRPSVSFADANVSFSCRAWSGGFEYRNLLAGSISTIEVLGGEVRFSASCTGGDHHVRGSAYLENLGAVTPETRALNAGSSTGSGGGLTDNQDTKLTELHQREGLVSGIPLVSDNNAGTITAGDIVLQITGDGINQSTATRVPVAVSNIVDESGNFISDESGNHLVG